MKIVIYGTVQTEEEIVFEKIKVENIKIHAEKIVSLLELRGKKLEMINTLPNGLAEFPDKYFKEALMHLTEAEYILKKINF